MSEQDEQEQVPDQDEAQDAKEAGPGQVQTPNPEAERRAAYVAALEYEREGYERRGLKDRVAAVDAELKRFGSAPKKRSAPKPQKG